MKKTYQFVMLVIVYPLVSSIKVDFGTRGGPILIPTSTTPPPHSYQPYREPSPVWEDQSNDIPNHTPFKYQLPTPSRSRENTINIFDPNYKQPEIKRNNPDINTSSPVNNFIPQFGDSHTLVRLYIPNEGYKYFVVISSNTKWKSNYIINEQNIFNSDQKYYKYDKYDEKYNAKLKKFKAYEKIIKPAFSQN